MIPDVLIIGAGAIGLSIAYTLIGRGLRVTLLDAGEPGKGASWAAAGVLAPQGAHPGAGSYLDLSLRSREMYEAFAEGLREDTGTDIQYRAEGGLHIALDHAEYEELMSRFRHQQALGLPVEYLGPEETLTLEPAISPDVRGSLLFTGMAQVDNRQMVRALRIAVGMKGGVVNAGVPVTGLTIRKDRLTRVETTQGVYKAGVVINAAGAWARLPTGGHPDITPPVKPVKGQMLAVDGVDGPSFRRVIQGKDQYLIPRGDGRLLVGATVEKVGFDTRVTAGGLSRLLDNAIRMAPSIANAPVIEIWAGLRPMSKDGKPILGPTPVAGLLLATGHYRNGILLTPVTAMLIADYITEGKVPAAMTPFLLERFSKAP